MLDYIIPYIIICGERVLCIKTNFLSDFGGSRVRVSLPLERACRVTNIILHNDVINIINIYSVYPAWIFVFKTGARDGRKLAI